MLSGSAANRTATHNSDLDIQVVFGTPALPALQQKRLLRDYKFQIAHKLAREVGTSATEDANKCLKIAMGRVSVDVLPAWASDNETSIRFWTGEGRETINNSFWYRQSSNAKDLATNGAFRESVLIAKSTGKHLGTKASSYAMERSVWAVPAAEFEADTVRKRMRRVGAHIIGNDSTEFHATMNQLEVPGIPVSDYRAAIRTWRTIVAHL